MKNIFFLWKDAPFYAVYIIKNLLDNSKYRIKLITKISKKNSVSYKKILKKNIINIRNKTYSCWSDFKLQEPDILFVSGWNYREFKGLINYSKAKNIKIVSMIDNNKKNNFRQLIGKYIFKTIFKYNFDAYWVPGESSQKLLNSYGIRNGIFKNLYSINRSLFNSKNNINKHSKITDWKLHDIRRTVATNLSKMGYDRLLIKRILNHVDRDVTAIYDRYQYINEKKDALQQWAEKLDKIVR